MPKNQLVLDLDYTLLNEDELGLRSAFSNALVEAYNDKLPSTTIYYTGNPQNTFIPVGAAKGGKNYIPHTSVYKVIGKDVCMALLKEYFPAAKSVLHPVRVHGTPNSKVLDGEKAHSIMETRSEGISTADLARELNLPIIQVNRWVLHSHARGKVTRISRGKYVSSRSLRPNNLHHVPTILKALEKGMGYTPDDIAKAANLRHPTIYDWLKVQAGKADGYMTKDVDGKYYLSKTGEAAKDQLELV